MFCYRDQVRQALLEALKAEYQGEALALKSDFECRWLEGEFLSVNRAREAFRSAATALKWEYLSKRQQILSA